MPRLQLKARDLVLEGAVDRRSDVFSNTGKHALHVVFFLPLCRRNVDRSRMGTSICWEAAVRTFLKKLLQKIVKIESVLNIRMLID